MRTARIKDTGTAYYHVVSRVIERQRKLTGDEKARFCKMLRAAAGFSGAHILTFTILGNHFHILLCVPESVEISDEELVHRLAFIYDKTMVNNVETALKAYRSDKNDQAAEQLKASYTKRMHDLSQFMKTLKQRFSQSYNGRHDRHGTLWEGRFRSSLVEGRQGALSTIAAYIDLNAVRAGIVKDPKDYRFCGYGEAVAGVSLAQQGLGLVMQTLDQSPDWVAVSRQYRQFLYVAGENVPNGPDGKPLRLGFDSETVRKILAEGGKLTLAQALTCKVRYFTDGVIFGSKEYVEAKFEQYRSFFSPNRMTGARDIKNGFTDLCTARKLRVDPIVMSTPG